MRDNCNWQCRICGWEMFIDSEIVTPDKADVWQNGHIIRCGKCGSMFKSRE